MAETRRVKIELAPETRVPAVGERWAGGIVVCSFPEIGDPNIVVEIDISAHALFAWAVDQRPEHADYGPVEAATAPRGGELVGDTYPPEAIRARGRLGAGITIGIVDTGLDAQHSAFIPSLTDTDIGDSHGHATHVASTAASWWGIASQARIVARAGIPGGNGTESSVANAIRGVVEAGAQIVNLSLGGSASSVIDAGCEFARRRGAIVVAAAGNTPGAAIGSPARAADVVVMACDRARSYTRWTSGPEWSTPNRVTDYGEAIWAAQAGTRDGARAMSGTSMAAPHVAGKLALLLASGLERAEALHYLFTHRASPPAVGVSILMPNDFGEAPGPPAGDWREDLRGIHREVYRLVDSAQVTGWLEAETRSALGSIKDYMDQADALIPPSAEPPPEPTPEPPPTWPDPTTVLRGFTAALHWDGSPYKIDWYPDSNGGSNGLPLSWPVGGQVYVKSQIGPLDSEGFDCCVHQSSDRDEVYLNVVPFGDRMDTVFLAADNGKTYAWTHVDDVRAGRRQAREPFAACGLSGLRNLPGDPSHFHLAVLSRLDPHWNGESGDLIVVSELEALGFRVERVARVPGPQDYLSGRAVAGRFR